MARALTAPGITVWSAWRDDDLVGIGALAQLDAARGELKSMRVDDRFRGSVDVVHGLTWSSSSTSYRRLQRRRWYADSPYPRCMCDGTSGR